jgi:hypothetical protein
LAVKKKRNRVYTSKEIYFPHTELDSHPKLISKDPLQGNKEIADLIL